MTRHTKSASCGHLVVLKSYSGLTNMAVFLSFTKTKQNKKPFQDFPMKTHYNSLFKLVLLEYV